MLCCCSGQGMGFIVFQLFSKLPPTRPAGRQWVDCCCGDSHRHTETSSTVTGRYRTAHKRCSMSVSFQTPPLGFPSLSVAHLTKQTKVCSAHYILHFRPSHWPPTHVHTCVSEQSMNLLAMQTWRLRWHRLVMDLSVLYISSNQ